MPLLPGDPEMSLLLPSVTARLPSLLRARSHGCVRFKQFKILAWHQSLVGPETGSDRTAIEMIPVFKHGQKKTYLRFLYIVSMGWNFVSTSYANAYIGWILSNTSWAKNPHTFEQFGKAREVGYTFVALSVKACHLYVSSSETRVSWCFSQHFLLLVALLSHYFIAVWTAQQFSFDRLYIEHREKAQKLPTEAPGCHLPCWPHLSHATPALLFPQKKGFVAGDKPSTPSIKKKKLQSQSDTVKRKSLFSSMLN